MVLMKRRINHSDKYTEHRHSQRDADRAKISEQVPDGRNGERIVRKTEIKIRILVRLDADGFIGPYGPWNDKRHRIGPNIVADTVELFRGGQLFVI